DGHRLVAVRVEILEHGGSRGERHFMLARPAAVDDADADLLQRLALISSSINNQTSRKAKSVTNGARFHAGLGRCLRPADRDTRNRPAARGSRPAAAQFSAAGPLESLQGV